MDKLTLVLGILLGAAGMYLIIHFLWSLGFYALATVFSALGGIRSPSSRGSKSLQNLEAMLLPRIKKDFPDFDGEKLKDQVRSCLQQQYGDRPNFTIDALALKDYSRQGQEYRLLCQALLQWQEKKTVKRQITVTLQADGKASSQPGSCPHCGAPFNASDRHCRSCGRLIDRGLGGQWSVCSMKES